MYHDALHIAYVKQKASEVWSFFLKSVSERLVRKSTCTLLCSFQSGLL